MFSIFDPGKAITWHRGHWRGVLRVQLVLDVPEGEGAVAIDVVTPHNVAEGDGSVRLRWYGSMLLRNTIL